MGEQYERRKIQVLTEEQINQIAEQAAIVALEKVYIHIGKSIVSKFLWICGVFGLSIAAWLHDIGKI